MSVYVAAYIYRYRQSGYMCSVGIYIYGKRRKLTEETQRIAAEISGHIVCGLSYTKAWKGTAYIRLVIGFASKDAKSVMEISELKLEELP